MYNDKCNDIFNVSFNIIKVVKNLLTIIPTRHGKCAK